MMETKYGMEKPVRLSFAEEETEPRGMIDGQAGELVDYTAWIQTSLDGEMVRANQEGGGATLCRQACRRRAALNG